jgi:CRP/FNR family transcriptional regulator
MLQIEQIALESIDQRLSRFLLKSANQQNMVTATHQEIAIEIGSAREVVSRHLKMLEKQKVIKLHRGKLELIDIGLLNS